MGRALVVVYAYAGEEDIRLIRKRAEMPAEIDTDVLTWFREKAEQEGRSYQTAMHEALRQYTQQDQRPLQELVREAVREELQALRTASAARQE